MCALELGGQRGLCDRSFSCQRNLKGEKLTDRASGGQKSTVGGKELFPTDSGPEAFSGIVGDHQAGRLPMDRAISFEHLYSTCPSGV